MRETMYAKSAYKYQLDPKNPYVIQRKPNRPYARWEKEWRVFNSATEAKIQLIRLGKQDGAKEAP